jgi:hypothetical protein
MAPLEGNHLYSSFCGFMHTNAMGNNGEPYPFKNPKPIINIPHMNLTTDPVTFTKSFGAARCYINLVDGSYIRLRERITGVASEQGTMMGKLKTVGSRWQFNPLISIRLIPGPAWMDPEISSSK